MLECALIAQGEGPEQDSNVVLKHVISPGCPGKRAKMGDATKPDSEQLA